MKFDYGPAPDRLGEFKLNLFRAGSRNSMERVVLFIEKPTGTTEGQVRKLVLVVRTEGSRLCMYQAILLGETKCAEFMGREDNLKLSALRVSAEKEEKPVREVLKMQFSQTQDAEAFKKTLSDFFSGEKTA